MTEVFVIIEKDGSGFKVEVKGVTGPACKQLTAQIEKDLGIVSGVHEKPEMHLGNSQQNKIGR
jgi:DUF2997 family protein